MITFPDIVAGLDTVGFSLPLWTVRRQMKGLDISKNDSGYYTTADAALLVGWNMRRDSYSSYCDFYVNEGAGLYEAAQAQFS